eukprot:TRINITY_DN57624_c0_g1_i1.p2 TRINITY_DN57624_c0_g1~~TRINITY_DN57624_c0_g1_i1.p2  ORF type:complete len:105 (+),score=5.28 TRINITY_DN57624_c0_g1_i1:277-591(+)
MLFGNFLFQSVNLTLPVSGQTKIFLCPVLLRLTTQFNKSNIILKGQQLSNTKYIHVFVAQHGGETFGWKHLLLKRENFSDLILYFIVEYSKVQKIIIVQPPIGE